MFRLRYTEAGHRAPLLHFLRIYSEYPSYLTISYVLFNFFDPCCKICC